MANMMRKQKLTTLWTLITTNAHTHACVELDARHKRTKQRSSAASEVQSSDNLDNAFKSVSHLFPSFLYRLVHLFMFSNLCNYPSSLQQLDNARRILVENGISGLSGRDFKLLSAEKKKISLYDELYESDESVCPRVSIVPSSVTQTNMSFLDNETGDLVCSPCEDPLG